MLRASSLPILVVTITATSIVIADHRYKHRLHHRKLLAALSAAAALARLPPCQGPNRYVIAVTVLEIAARHTRLTSRSGLLED